MLRHPILLERSEPHPQDHERAVCNPAIMRNHLNRLPGWNQSFKRARTSMPTKNLLDWGFETGSVQKGFHFHMVSLCH
jgi:hypothetical protein